MIMALTPQNKSRDIFPVTWYHWISELRK